MDEYKIHNYIEDYPCQNDEDIQWKTACRKEFNELISKSNEIEKKGNFYHHQEMFTRYTRQYNYIFNIQGTGTGKTGSIINLSEFYKKHNEGIKRVYILEPGEATQNDFKNQVIKLTDPEDYINEKIKYSSSNKSLKNNLTRSLKNWYKIDTYQKFTKDNLSDQQIEEYYSDCIFFLDEAHKGVKFDDSKDTFVGGMDDKVYNFLWRITHLAKRSKFIVTTATPMINSSSDFVILLNLLLPMNYQLPLYNEKDLSIFSKESKFYDLLTLSQLEPFFRGKITFIRFMESNLDIIYKGEILKDYFHSIKFPASKNLKGENIKPWKKKIDNGNIITYDQPTIKNQKLVDSSIKNYPSNKNIFTLIMEENSIQLGTYLDIKKDKNKTGSFALEERFASVFVFPNKEVGSKAFRKFINKDHYGNYDFNPTAKPFSLGAIISKDLTKLDQSLNNLKKLSVKFEFYIRKEIENSNKDKPGNSFCFIEFVEAQGAILLSIFLKKFGFTEYISNISNITDTGEILIKPAKRFALLTGQSKNIQDTLDFFNSEKNVHGNYIQMIIASDVVREGINIKNVVRGYIMTPGWHEAGMYQALSRFVRADSHDYLAKRTPDEKIKIDIYNMAAITPTELDDIEKKGIKGASIDIKLYLRSENKDIRNKRILRFMKQTAFDAYINYDRNTFSNEKDGCSVNDYDVKKFKIWKAEGLPGNTNRKGIADNQGPNKRDFVYNTYNMLYTKDLIDITKKFLIRILQKIYCIKITDFVSLLKKKIYILTNI